jgi:hypothetical protein
VPALPADRDHSLSGRGATSTSGSSGRGVWLPNGVEAVSVRDSAIHGARPAKIVAVERVGLFTPILKTDHRIRNSFDPRRAGAARVTRRECLTAVTLCLLFDIDRGLSL